MINTRAPDGKNKNFYNVIGPSVKHVLGVFECSYVVPEKNVFLEIRVWFGMTPTPSGLVLTAFVGTLP